MPYRFIMVIGLALLPTTMAGCANQEAFTAAIMPNWSREARALRANGAWRGPHRDARRLCRDAKSP